MRRALAVALLLLLPAYAHADALILKNGRRIVGVIVERTPDMIFMEVGPGRIGFPMSKVERIETTPSSLDEYRRRAARLASADAAGWLELGLWASEQAMATQARHAFEHVLSLDPNNAAAHAALGDARSASGWTSADEVRRKERDSEAAARDEQERAERAAAKADGERAAAEARIREAEARAREAEAARQAAEDERAAPYGPAGEPYGPGFVPILPPSPVASPEPCRHCGDAPAPAAAPTPRPHDGPRQPPVTPTSRPPKDRRDGLRDTEPH